MSTWNCPGVPENPNPLVSPLSLAEAVAEVDRALNCGALPGVRYPVVLRGHYHDATGYEDRLCACPSPLTYAPQPRYHDPREGE